MLEWAYPNFSRQEVECKCGCGFLPTPEFMKKLQELRLFFGKPMVVTSGARCEAHNVKIGGSAKSKHISGMAIDVATPWRWDLVQIAMQQGFHGIGIARTYLHLDTRPLEERAIWQYGEA